MTDIWVQNEHTSPEAKKHAREILEAHGYTAERAEGVSQDEYNSRVYAGYKAALNSEFRSVVSQTTIANSGTRSTCF